MKNKLFSIIVALSALLFAAACENNDGDLDGNNLKVTFAEQSLQFAAGEEATVTFIVTGATEVCTIDEERTEAPVGWQVRYGDFSRTEASVFMGKLHITAPSEESTGTIVIYVKSASGAIASGSIDVASSNKLSEDVVLTVEEKTIAMNAAETKTVAFTVREEIKRDLAATISTLDDKWAVRIVSFVEVDGGYDGQAEITAPADNGKTSISLHIDNKADNKTLAATTINATCTAPESGVVLTLETQSVTLTPGKSTEIAFTATGKDAVDLQANLTVSSTNWQCAIDGFAPAETGGYAGKIAITAPNSVESTKARLAVCNKAGDELAVASIALASSNIQVDFDQQIYRFGALEEIKINLTVTCSEVVTLKSITTALWSVKEQSAQRNSDNSGYTGYVKLQSPSIPDEADFVIRVIDSDNQESEFAVKVVCEGGIVKPAAHAGANCIVVENTGTVSFDAVKGNGEAVAGSKVVCIWTDAEGLIESGSLAYKNGKISFKTGSSFTAGNALVALTDDAGTIKWSWHLWFVQGLNLNAASGTFMNMNLGATSSDKVAESIGLLYQWGRKEAFPGPKDFTTDVEKADDAFNADNMRPFVLADGYKWGVLDEDMTSHEAAAQHPTEMMYLASQLPSSKTTAPWSAEADPCPKGWRVPNHHELAEHWGVIDGHVFVPNDYSQFGNGAVPTNYPDEWWPAAGNRMTHNGISGWNGALRLTNYAGYYWSSTSNYCQSEYDSEADIQDIGYNSAAVLSWSTYNSLNIGLSVSNAKSTATSVRCIKE